MALQDFFGSRSTRWLGDAVAGIKLWRSWRPTSENAGRGASSNVKKGLPCSLLRFPHTHPAHTRARAQKLLQALDVAAAAIEQLSSVGRSDRAAVSHLCTEFLQLVKVRGGSAVGVCEGSAARTEPAGTDAAAAAERQNECSIALVSTRAIPLVRESFSPSRRTQHHQPPT